MKKAELVFIPSPGITHLIPAVGVAKLIVDRDERFSITFLIMKLRVDPKIDSYIDSMSAVCKRIRFVDLPKHEPDPNQPSRFLFQRIEAQKQPVTEAVFKLVSRSELSPDSPRLAGIVVDMFCTSMIDVANEFGVPSYLFFVSSASFLALEFYIEVLHDEQKVDPTELKDSNAELVVPFLANPLPAKVLPSAMLKKEWLSLLLGQVRRFKEFKGVLVNTFEELESPAVNFFSNGNTPRVYPVGPLLNLNRDGDPDGSNTYEDIKQWLDDQPQSSVVYLCFGTLGSFDVDQVKEIACALEQSGNPFLWSLRQPPPKGKMEAPSDYLNPQEVLPEGFLDRTAGIGKIIGWAPQIDILSHSCIGGFVSHCGWNSVLESIWFDVPIATIPLYAEHQLSAFQMIVELGLAVEIKMDYRLDFFNTEGNESVITAKEIERGIRCLMEFDPEKRKKLKEMSEKSRKAWMSGGSSYTWLNRLIQDMIDDMP
ncbi:unnamed protein product [Dovyalis caffra]|uniref:Glycosyltransferase n=1 Tax=Dovyalis caffra TaxID=77055 RepID=A0AAV1S500_9ROSI|nr:unnamed protein product [Dovyalis caffra]